MNPIFTPENQPHREGFMVIYDAFYIVIFVGCYITSGLMTIDLASFETIF
jgi:hypothetical protein